MRSRSTATLPGSNIIKKLFLALLFIPTLFLAVALLLLRLWILPSFDATHNAVLMPDPQTVSAQTRDFHQRSFVADLHADPLLWARDLRSRQSRGHVDVPRLRAGGVDLQVFSVVSKVPTGANYSGTPASSDMLQLLFIASWRSPSTWFSPQQRALTQAAEMKLLAQQTGMIQVLTGTDLEREGLKGLLALEGMHALEGDNSALQKFHAAGFRMVGLAHHFDNAFAGSAHGMAKYGLTKSGRSAIREMERLGITIDLAHASPKAFEQTLLLATQPVVVSHTGVDGTCPGPRNLSDEELRGITENGGVVGIGYWKGAVCDASIAGIVKAIRYAVSVAGIDHVGLGSDFDGHVITPFDASGIPMLTQALLDSGLSQDDVAKILGANVRRVLLANLPS